MRSPWAAPSRTWFPASFPLPSSNEHEKEIRPPRRATQAKSADGIGVRHTAGAEGSADCTFLCPGSLLVAQPARTSKRHLPCLCLSRPGGGVAGGGLAV